MASMPLIAENAHKIRSLFFQALVVWGFFLFGMADNSRLFGQTPVFRAVTDAKEAIVGVPFEISFVLEGGEGHRFSPPSLRDFRSGGVSESRGVTIINGRANSRQTWSYTLEPLRAGTFTIGPASVTLPNGNVVRSNQLTITVLSAAAVPRGVPDRNDEVFITGELSQKSCLPGEQVKWRLVLYTRVAIEGADLISLPSFDGFYTKERKHFNTKTEYQNIRGKKYAVKTLHEESIFPQNTGELTIGSAQIRVGIEQPGTQGFLFGPKPVTLTSQAVVLTVKPMPEPVPENFTGAVGRYSWELTGDSASLSTDDALTLNVTIKGTGDGRRVGAPKFAVPPTCEIFEPRVIEEKEYEDEDDWVYVKKFEYVILPKEPGLQEFAPAMSYYAPDSNRYCTLTAIPVRFNVTPGKNYRPNGGIDTTALPLEIAARPDPLERIKSFMSGPLPLTILGGALLGLGIFFLIKRRKQSPPAHRVVQTSKTDPSFEARLRINRAANLLTNAKPGVFYDELLKGLQSYIAARLQLSTAQMDHNTVLTRLIERGVTPIRAQAFLSIWQTCEQAVYAGHPEASKMESDWRAADTVVGEIEREMR